MRNELTQVETSSNLASVSRTVPDSETPGFSYDILCSTRSSLSSSLEAVRRQIKTAGELSGASDVTIRPPYPGWQPDLGSNALKVMEVGFTFFFLFSFLSRFVRCMICCVNFQLYRSLSCCQREE